MAGKLKHFLFFDAETFYSKEFSLRRMSVPEYILNPQFAVHLLAVYDINWKAPKVLLPHEIQPFLDKYPAAETIACAHNMLFDGAILAWKYGWVAGRLQDTLGQVRALRSYQKYSLESVLKELFGYSEKGDIIYKVQGLDIQGIKDKGLWPDYCTYAMNDVRLCSNIYFKLLPEFPVEEQRLMDLVLRCAIVPKLHADTKLLSTHLGEIRRRKTQLLQDCGYDKAALMSTAQFQKALEAIGVPIEFKISATGRKVPAFAKTDQYMATLQEYVDGDDETNFRVQTLAAARLAHKSTIEETRAEKFLSVASLPWGNGALLPAALRYGGAHTHRLSGEWGLNLQNLPRDKSKSKLRQALRAGPGCKLVTADLSQIEARIVAVLAGQQDLVEDFRQGQDVYAQFASKVFRVNVTKKSHPDHRFVGKTAILGLGYGAGVPRFYRMVLALARQYGIPLEGLFDWQVAEETVGTYRRLFKQIGEIWTFLDSALRNYISNFDDNSCLRHGPVIFQSGKITLPNAMTLRYKIGDQHLYGAKLLENITQALARIVLMQAALRIADRGYRFVLQVHDELVYSVPEEDVEDLQAILAEELIRPPAWLPQLPLAFELGVGDDYASCK
jgi:DNA polymerase family A